MNFWIWPQKCLIGCLFLVVGPSVHFLILNDAWMSILIFLNVNFRTCLQSWMSFLNSLNVNLFTFSPSWMSFLNLLNVKLSIFLLFHLPECQFSKPVSPICHFSECHFSSKCHFSYPVSPTCLQCFNFLNVSPPHSLPTHKSLLWPPMSLCAQFFRYECHFCHFQILFNEPTFNFSSFCLSFTLEEAFDFLNFSFYLIRNTSTRSSVFLPVCLSLSLSVS